MHISAVWIAPLAAGGIGAAALAAGAAAVRRQVSDLHRALRPLRVKSRAANPPVEPQR